jgi:hypothetical protein
MITPEGVIAFNQLMVNHICNPANGKNERV